ncbi:protein kinase [candidate division CSSED10-310 bacterium]|uniref:Protein kinase n=1 Tax=candidate division CSSED10-310 bacterium TaxID=2855610 RepID=A0ABV6YT62_UNCC1
MITLPGFTITEHLYESNNSHIYRGYRRTDERPVVLKMLRKEYPTPLELARFRREYEMTQTLKIAGVIQASELVEYKNTLIIVLEDFGGESLTRLLRSSQFTVSQGDFVTRGSDH